MTGIHESIHLSNSKKYLLKIKISIGLEGIPINIIVKITDYTSKFNYQFLSLINGN